MRELTFDASGGTQRRVRKEEQKILYRWECDLGRRWLASRRPDEMRFYVLNHKQNK